MPIRPGDTPVPIPNTMVKTRAADGTMLETVWESRRMPDINSVGMSFRLKERTDITAIKKNGIRTLKTAYRTNIRSTMKRMIGWLPFTGVGRLRTKDCEWKTVVTFEECNERANSKNSRVPISSYSLLITRHPRKTEKDPCAGATLCTGADRLEIGRKIKRRRAQGGCLGTKSR